jgi:D-alanyl-D-alanine carboxypeptidase
MGFEGDFLGLEEPSANLAVITGQTIIVHTTDGETKEHVVPTKYLPDPAYQDFLRLNDAIERQIGRRLLIASGYRSPAYQAVVFLGSAIHHNFDLAVTGRLVALPGYSQHGLASSPAIDVSATEVDENVLDIEFAKSEEYTWLMQHASEFNYYLSYPEGNADGVSFEPWHWQWRG